MIIDRKLWPVLKERIENNPAVALLGPRQIGKTTLALEYAKKVPSLYLDLESESDRAKLTNPRLFLEENLDKLVILDEVQRVPELFQTLRGLIDKARREGSGNGRYLLLGSASMDLLRQSGESLAGRISYLEMTPLVIPEIPESDMDKLWVRGGFPDSFFSQNEALSLQWRRDFIKTYLERDVPQFGSRVPAETLSRFWTMLAHNQGQIFNASQLAKGLGVSGATVSHYLDLMVDLMLVRRLMPYHANLGKRLVKSPKVYIRDSGITHALLRIRDKGDLLGHPVVGQSWEAFILENIIANVPQGTDWTFYRTSVGAEIDLVLKLPGGEKWAVEAKLSTHPKLKRGFYIAKEDVQPDRSFVIYSGQDQYPLEQDLQVLSLERFIKELVSLS